MPESPQRQRIHRAIELLQKLSELFQQRRRALARSVGLTEQQWRVLEEISTEQFIPSLFARQKDSSAAAVSKVTRLLLDKGLIGVSISAQDGRQRNYELTAAGQSVMAKLRASRARAVDAIWQPLGTDSLQQFISVSTTLIERIEAYDAEEE